MTGILTEDQIAKILNKINGTNTNFKDSPVINSNQI